MVRALTNLADFRRDESVAIKLRLRRIALLKSFLSSLNKPLKILDVGGTEIFWERMGFAGAEGIEITILNLSEEKVHHPNFRSVSGDARNMFQFCDGAFDVVFSNSVLEHVGSYEDQKRMAMEVQRVGKHFFVQTPNYYFPLEPHFLFPFFQFFPLWLKVFLLGHFNLGWYRKISDEREAIKIANSVRLLKETELRELFPDATIHREKFCGLTICFIVYK
ncbi:MAG: methyltransferase domain-containing protein [Thermoplasmata archaeon]|nr:methyltransferase domain-containing protein [Thermoplasmata archaeon]